MIAKTRLYQANGKFAVIFLKLVLGASFVSHTKCMQNLRTNMSKTCCQRKQKQCKTLDAKEKNADLTAMKNYLDISSIEGKLSLGF